MIGSVILEGLAYEFRSRTDAEDALVKWTDSDGNVQAKLSGAGQLKLYNAPVVSEDVGTAGYTATYYLPLEGGTLSGALNMGGFKITNAGAATADTDMLTRVSADSRFLKQSDAATTYLTQAAATATYLTQAAAATNYAPATGSTVYATQASLNNYYTSTQALQTFAPISGSQAYAPASGSANYASTASLNNYAPKASPTFTGTVDVPVLKTDYIASPSLPLSGSHGIYFDAGVNPTGGIAMGPTIMYLVAPNQSGAAISCLKNTATPTFIGVNASAFNVSSARALKDILGELTGALERLAGLAPVFYALKTDEDKVRQIGLIAEDVEAVLPEAVSEVDGHKGLDYGRLSVLAIAAIKELLVRVEALEAKA